MAVKRTDRLNSSLKEVISDVIKRDVENPHVTQLVTVTRVEITKDLHHCKVFISVIGSDQEKKQTLEALQSAAGFIAVKASHKVVMRYFPELTFKLDTSLEKYLRIEELLHQIDKDKKARPENFKDDLNE